MVVLDPTQFRKVCGRFATGVAVATILDEGGTPKGLTVNSFVSVSLEPPIISISIERAASIREPFLKANAFGISVLKEEDQWLSERFAYGEGDRFEGVSWQSGQLGVPLLREALATMECTVERHIEVGDHTLFLGEVRFGETPKEGLPLVFYASAYQRLERLRDR